MKYIVVTDINLIIDKKLKIITKKAKPNIIWLSHSNVLRFRTQ